MKTLIIYPTTLFYSANLGDYDIIYVIEDPIYFTKHNYHKLKLLLHRSSMKYYYDFAVKKSKHVEYIDFFSATGEWYKSINSTADKIYAYDSVNNELESKLSNIFNSNLTILDSPQFLTTRDELSEYYDEHVLPNKMNDKSKKNSFSHGHFYKWQRRRLDVLMTKNGKPVSGKWTYDTVNREKFPKGELPIYDYKARVKAAKDDHYIKEAKDYVTQHFANNYGSPDLCMFDYTPKMAEESLSDFLSRRFASFGPYQDAVEPDIDVGFHSMLSHSLNIGIITPKYVLDKCLRAKVPIESLEGFIRQLIGWREYVRLIYIYEGEKMRKANYWDAKNKLGEYWWSSNDYIYKYIKKDSAKVFDENVVCADNEHIILPLDVVLNKVYNISYAHHIERLMYIGCIMFMLQVHPDEVYNWFMSCCSIDAYDWVMVPNIYGMSQNADFGTKNKMMKKPYFASANYVSKLSSYSKSSIWASNWNSIYYLFLNNNSAKVKGASHFANFMLSSFKKHESGNLSKHKKIFGKLKKHLIA